MKNKFKYVLMATLLAIGFVACEESETKENKSEEEVIDMHTSQNALDWEGVYYGILPCADCEGIEHELTLNDDNTYLLVIQYMVEGDEPDSIRGAMSWEEDGNTISLEGVSDHASNLYKVEENQVRHLDQEGNRIEGELEEFYVLKKLGNPQLEDKRWVLVELNGEKIDGSDEKYYLIFHSENRRAETKSGCNIINISYKITDFNTIEFGQGASTMMACPEDITDQYLDVLADATTIETNEGVMIFKSEEGDKMAVYELVE